MKKVTCWYMQNKDSSWSYNHFSDGWKVGIFPRAINKAQKANWRKHKWKQIYAYMTDDGLISENAFRIVASVALEEHENYYIPSDKQTHMQKQIGAIEPRCPYGDFADDK